MYQEQKEAELAQAKVSAQEMRASASAKAEELDAQYQLREKRAALQTEAAARKAAAVEAAAVKAAELDAKYQLSSKKEALRTRAMASGRLSKGLARFAEKKAAAAQSIAEFQEVASVREPCVCYSGPARQSTTAAVISILGCLGADSNVDLLRAGEC